MSTIFPKWTNRLPTVLVGGVLCGLALAVGGAWYYFTPKYWRVGYMPAQPHVSEQLRANLVQTARTELRPAQIPGENFPGFSHQIHAGKLGMDCRYCHTHVEAMAEANIPSASVCMGCHADGHVNDQKFAKKERVQFIREAWAADASIPWRRIHKVPDYVRNFPHNVHVNAGVSCFSCHGNIMEMPVVYHQQPLSMAWCLECHRNPEPSLVPKDKVTDLYWVRKQLENGNVATSTVDVNNPGSAGGTALLKALEEKKLHLLPQNCGACHY